MRFHLPVVVAMLLAGGAAACGGGAGSSGAGTDSAAAALPATAPAGGAPAATAAAPQAAGAPRADVFTGSIVETMNAGGYTYARLQNGSAEAWIAAPEFDARQGEQISAALDMPMRDFQSRTLNRTFPLLYFVQEVGRNGRPAAAAQGAPPSLMNSHGGAAAAPPTVQKLDPPSGGLSIADVYARKDALNGKPVTVRGTVVKYNGGILDRNWLHIQDGSGSAASRDNDLTVTTDAEAKVGDVVTASGTVGTGKDFGAGYAYDVIVEKARVIPDR